MGVHEGSLEGQRQSVGPELLPLYWDDASPIPPQSWCVNKVLEAGTVNLLIGASGAGKSFLAIDLGVSVAQGEPFFGFSTKKGGVLYGAAEGGYTIRRRLRAAKGGNRDPRPFSYLANLP